MDKDEILVGDIVRVKKTGKVGFVECISTDRTLYGVSLAGAVEVGSLSMATLLSFRREELETLGIPVFRYKHKGDEETQNNNMDKGEK